VSVSAGHAGYGLDIVTRKISSYASELRPLLSPGSFLPARSRMLRMPMNLAVIVLATLFIVHGDPGPFVLAGVSLVIGVAFSGLVFLGHEVLHGAVVRGRRARHVAGWISFLPFVISPRLWVAWHNRVHHGQSNHAGIDPDAYPTLGEYRSSGKVRVVTDWFSIGRGRLRGLTSLLVGFSVQSAHMLIMAGKRGYLGARQHRLALLETALGVSTWLALLVVLGPVDFLFACAAPLVVANIIVMAHIFTNHSLSPLTEVNDPLANSLSVTVPRWVDWFTLRFGFHVEHHLFPSMSSRHAVEVRQLLVTRFPDRYQSMPLWRALLRVHRTPRVYEQFTTLLDPTTGRRAQTLGAGTKV
jgi:fatty acid desaturase